MSGLSGKNANCFNTDAHRAWLSASQDEIDTKYIRESKVRLEESVLGCFFEQGQRVSIPGFMLTILSND